MCIFFSKASLWQGFAYVRLKTDIGGSRAGGVLHGQIKAKSAPFNPRCTLCPRYSERFAAVGANFELMQ
jgi:hypothetical protein